MVVLAAFVLAFLLPWDSEKSFVTLAWSAFAERSDSVERTIFSVILSILVACISAILWPSARVLGIVYRTVLVILGFPMLLIIALLYPGLMVEAWGVPLYGATLVFAFTVEVFPLRRPPERDYSEVFR